MEEKYISEAKSTATVGREVAEKLTDRELEYVRVADRNLVAEIDAIALMDSSRFDILAKYIYAKFYKLNVASDWGLRLYSEHLRLLNGYHEPDGSGKCGESAFVAEFHNVLASIKERGFDRDTSIVPIVNGEDVVDGGHRLAACAVYNSPVSVLFAEAIAQKDYQYIPPNYFYFKERALSQDFSDAMALEYCRLKPNLHLLLLWPNVRGKDGEIERILQNYGRIFYQKDIFLFNRGPANLLQEIEFSETGTPISDRTRFQEKAHTCFNPPGITRAYGFEPDRPQDLLAVKTQISALFSEPDRSFYINENPATTLHLAELLFNDNSIDFLNTAFLENSPCFSELLIYYKKWLQEGNIDPECTCIADRAVLAAYGIEKCDRLEFLHHGYDELTDTDGEFQSHNAKVHFYDISKDDLIFNPQHYFYYRGLKFTSLTAFQRLKEARRNPTDLEEMDRLNLFLASPTVTGRKLSSYGKLVLSYWGIYLVRKKGSIYCNKFISAIGRRFHKLTEFLSRSQGD